MTRRKVKHTYNTVKIPSGLTRKIDEMVTAEDYTSRTDVIKTAVRMLYRQQMRKKKLILVEDTSTGTLALTNDVQKIAELGEDAYILAEIEGNKISVKNPSDDLEVN